MPDDALIVLDIGKTNAKLTLVDASGRPLAELRRPNAIVQGPPYPHHDTAGIWQWLLAGCHAFARQADVAAIVPVTHGATAALVADDDLVLPVLDYEARLTGIDYDALRPAYAETLSPRLPAGLNLGRQLAWLAQRFPGEFGRAQHILTYPQYWAWRLCGVPAAEATSLGCHTDLWDPLARRFSSLPERMGWQGMLPPLAPAWKALGTLHRHLAARTGLPEDCAVLCGIHDSNASLLRHLGQHGAQRAHTVLSTGTWIIAAAIGAPLDGLREDADMLANTTTTGEPVACMRFMGGREFSLLAGPRPEPCTTAELEATIADGTMALPGFADSGGPFPHLHGRIDGPAPQSARARYAMATLYCALMTDYCLTALRASGPIAVEGSFTENPHFGTLLAELRPGQTVRYSDDTSGTTCGGWLLYHRDRQPGREGTIMKRRPWPGLLDYKRRWRALLELAKSADPAATAPCAAPDARCADG